MYGNKKEFFFFSESKSLIPIVALEVIRDGKSL